MGGCFRRQKMRLEDSGEHHSRRVLPHSSEETVQQDQLSHQLSAISYQLSAISYQRSAISDQLSAISYQLSAISYQAVGPPATLASPAGTKKSEGEKHEDISIRSQCSRIRGRRCTDGIRSCGFAYGA